MNWSEIDTWIVVTGALISMACALPGLFLLLNRQSMLGDAISHSVLPGLAIAFLATHSRAPWAMLIGAVIAGLLTGVLTQLVQRYGKVEPGAAMGVVFCSLFALGLILIRAAADHVDLDPGCVLYGTIETAVVDVGTVPGMAWQSAAMLAVNLVLTWFCYKELTIVAFDPAMAATQGINATWVRQALVIITAITTVLAFESVGSILVIAMLVAPAAAATLLSHRLPVILVLTLLFAAISAGLGHIAAIAVFPPLLRRMTGLAEIGATSSAGMMAVTAGVVFVLCLGWYSVARQRGHRQVEAPAI
ncbi:MAG: metal ABC transporter permease [Opitutaceae bacterium]